MKKFYWKAQLFCLGQCDCLERVGVNQSGMSALPTSFLHLPFPPSFQFLLFLLMHPRSSPCSSSRFPTICSKVYIAALKLFSQLNTKTTQGPRVQSISRLTLETGMRFLAALSSSRCLGVCPSVRRSEDLCEKVTFRVLNE